MKLSLFYKYWLVLLVVYYLFLYWLSSGLVFACFGFCAILFWEFIYSFVEWRLREEWRTQAVGVNFFGLPYVQIIHNLAFKIRKKKCFWDNKNPLVLFNNYFIFKIERLPLFLFRIPNGNPCWTYFIISVY